MTQQERILKLAQEKIGYIGQGGTRQWGKSFKAGFGMAIKFTLENLWIPVEEDLPESTSPVFIIYEHGIFEVGYCEREYGETKWYLERNRSPIILVSHWMPISTPNNIKS